MPGSSKGNSVGNGPLPTRVGGFGGVAGLQAYLQAERISHVVDATLPFAAQMSSNAVQACTAAGVPLLALERPAWQAQSGDVWTHVADIAAAVQALPRQPARVFLAIGKQNLAPFLACAQHWYLLRLVDPVLDLPAELALPEAYTHALVLCRADQHVVWRGNALPADAHGLVQQLCGVPLPA